MSALKKIDSLEAAKEQPNAMINDDGEIFYADNPDLEDATRIEEIGDEND